MKKELKGKIILIIFVVSLLMLPVFVHAAELTEDQKVDKAYSWLKTQVRGKWNALNTKENILAMLALQCNSTFLNDGNASLNRRKFTSTNITCWSDLNVTQNPDQCKVVETSLADVAYTTLGWNATKINNWLLSRKKAQTDFPWYLQIDTARGNALDCEVYYLGVNDGGFIINEDKTVVLNGTHRCFSGVSGPTPGYWFKIKNSDPECFNTDYAIKCFSDNATYFTATFLYKLNEQSNDWYVSSVTKTGIPIPHGNQEEPKEVTLTIPSFCLADGNTNNCNYEGTAWATYALFQQGDTDNANLFIPYLIINKDKGDNKGYFPSAFLSAIIDGRFTDEAIKLKQETTDYMYWKIQKPNGGVFYGNLYNTALAKLMLKDSVTWDKAKAWILSKQQIDGYFSDSTSGTGGESLKRDNAFVLWMFWPGSCTQETTSCEMNGGACRDSCLPLEEENFFFTCPNSLLCCMPSGQGEGGEMCAANNGTCSSLCSFDEYEFVEGACSNEQKCCVSYSETTCDFINGTFCLADQTCSLDEVFTSDATTQGCCIGTCRASDTSNMYCSDLGEDCDSGQTCINSITRLVKDFTPSLDSQTCCEGTCAVNQQCSEIGQECGASECNGNVVATLDTDTCCDGTCKSDCTDLDGTICTADESCSTRFATNSNEPRCCLGECKQGKGFSFIWIIIIIIVVIAALYFFVIKKKSKNKENKEEDFFGFPKTTPITPGGPGIPLLMPRRPIAKQPPRQMSQSFPRLPVIQPTRMQPFKPITTETKTTKKITTVTKEKKGDKTELEKTLEKLKKMTKK